MQQQSWQQLLFTIYHSAKQSPVISELCPGMLAWICLSASPFCLSASPFCLLASPVCVPVVMLCICSSHLQTAARFNPVQPQPLTSFGMLYRSPSYTMSNNPVCQQFTCILAACSALALCKVVLKLCSAFALCVTYSPWVISPRRVHAWPCRASWLTIWPVCIGLEVHGGLWCYIAPCLYCCDVLDATHMFTCHEPF